MDLPVWHGWIDLNNNGLLELMVTNGHVDDVDAEGIDYKMPAQLLNSASGNGCSSTDPVWANTSRKIILAVPVRSMRTRWHDRCRHLASVRAIFLLINHTTEAGKGMWEPQVDNRTSRWNRRICRHVRRPADHCPAHGRRWIHVQQRTQAVHWHGQLDTSRKHSGAVAIGQNRKLRHACLERRVHGGGFQGGLSTG